MQTEARAECLTSPRRRAQTSAPRIVGDAGGHVPSGTSRPYRSRSSQWASFEAAQTYRLVVSRLVVSSLEVGSAGSEIVCQSNPSRESRASPRGPSLLRGGCAPSSDATAAGVSGHRRGSSGTLGCLASFFVSSSRFLPSFDCIVAEWHGRRLGPSTARSRCDFPAVLRRLVAALPQRGAARPHVLAFTTRSRIAENVALKKGHSGCTLLCVTSLLFESAAGSVCRGRGR